MIRFLASIFIKDHKNYRSPAVRRAYGMLCGITGICLNILLFALKLFAGTVTGAISVTADAFNNLSDAGSSIISLIGFRLSGTRPDPEHPFGHGRIEYISGLIVSMVILLMGFELALSSVKKIIAPEPMEFSYVTIGILSASILVKFYMAYYNRATDRKIDSPSLRATSVDSLSDCISTFVILVSIIVFRIWNINVDAWCGLFVSLFILIGGFRAAKDTVSPLLGQPPSPELVDEIQRIVMSSDEILGLHDLVVHDYGPGRLMISLHAEVSASADMIRTHDIIDNIERRLASELGCEAVIHMDPVLDDDETTTELRKRVSDLVARIGDGVSIHDFKVVTGPTHTNLIFDIVVPYSVKMEKKEITSKVNELIRELGDNYFAVFKIDNAYVK